VGEREARVAERGGWREVPVVVMILRRGAGGGDTVGVKLRGEEG
jgi:hypothetical protein